MLGKILASYCIIKKLLFAATLNFVAALSYIINYLVMAQLSLKN